MNEKTLYFAYGSNLNLDQMARRCPDAEPVGFLLLRHKTQASTIAFSKFPNRLSIPEYFAAVFVWL